ncbi:restriction endonuclease subunit S [Mesorhizobium sp. M0633]|uniref:restriction endonuclease subunit S n=1 Tax=Mesorhizobium sp. M0633 TaxID=2956977 RepID=UPI00333B7221
MSELPTGWAVANLQTLSGTGGLVSDGDWIESKDQDPNGQVRLIQLADIGDGFFRNRSARFVTEVTARRLRCTFLKKGDLLIARMPDPLGRACIFPGLGREAITSVDILIWRVQGGNIDTNWVMYSINSPNIRQIIAGKASGSTRQRIASSRLKLLELPVPPLVEQRRIVGKVEGLTAKSARAREELSRIGALAARFKEKLLEKAFSGNLTAEWRTANNLPAAKEVKLGEVATDFSYGSASKSLPYGTVPVLRMGNIQNGILDWSSLVYTSDKNEIERYALRKGDVLFNRTNSPALVGKTALYQDERPAIYAGYLIRVICQPRLDPLYLTHCLNSPLGRKYCWRVKSDGVSQSNINASKLKAFFFPLPELLEQREIVLRIESAFAKIDQVLAEAKCALALTNRLDQAILAKAVKGGLVPQDPGDEPASVLLERIADERIETRSQKPSGPNGEVRDNLISTQKARKLYESAGSMEKTRNDVSNDHLTGLLKEEGNMPPEKLWRQSGMSIDEFYKQLRFEMKAKSIRESVSSELEAA